MDQFFSFSLRCPTCGCECLTETYDRGELLRLLELGQLIEARCTECNVHWPIGREVRAQIARVVLVESFGSPRRGLRPVIDLTLLPLARVYRWNGPRGRV